MDALVSTEWLAAQLGASDLRVADASWFLPEHGRDGAAEFAAGHIPGAVFMDLDAFANTASPLPSMLPSPEQLASRMQAIGRGDGVRIVSYDDSPLHSSARAWWMLQAFGTPAVEDRDIVRAERAQHPPCPCGGMVGRNVVDFNQTVVATPER